MEQETATHSKCFRFFKSMEICTQYCFIRSGDKETEELKRENGEATKTISVLDDSKIVKDDQESIVVREPQSLNEKKEDEKIILSDVTLENKKEEDTTGKPEEVFV